MSEVELYPNEEERVSHAAEARDVQSGRDAEALDDPRTPEARDEATEEAEADEDIGEECRVGRRVTAPRNPSRSEIEDHVLNGHTAFRSWCPHCVRGRGRRTAHIPSSHSELARISFLLIMKFLLRAVSMDFETIAF